MSKLLGLFLAVEEAKDGEDAKYAKIAKLLILCECESNEASNLFKDTPSEI